MSKLQTFLIKDSNGREAVMRLPVSSKYGEFTQKAYQIIGRRFFDGITGECGRMEYAINLEAFSNADDLISALENYKSATP